MGRPGRPRTPQPDGFSLTSYNEDWNQAHLERKLLRGDPAPTRKHDERIADLLAVLHP